MKEMFDPAFVANEAEAFVDQQARDGTRRHTRVLQEPRPGHIPVGVPSCAGGEPEESGPHTTENADLPI